MKLLKKSDEKIIFVTKIDETFANSIRRASFEVPILAIDEVEFYKNDSILYDEVLALRLGLIPLKTPDDMNLKEDCSCKGKGCAKCTIQLKLQSVGEKTIYASELKGKVEVIYPKMPITKLEEGQELEFVATATLGKGIQHSKYVPGLVYYRNLVVCKNCKSSHEITDEKEEDINECDICSKKNDELYQGKELVIFIESWGQIKAKDIFLKSVKAIKENLKDLE